MNSKDIAMSAEAGQPAINQAVEDYLTEIENQIYVLKVNQNHSILSIGKLLEEVHVNKRWREHGYDSEDQWLADPNGVGMAPRTARLYRLLWRLWEKKLAKLGVTEQQILAIDHCKLAYIAKKLKKENNPDNILELIHMAKTNTLRQLQAGGEEEEYYIFRGSAHVCKWLNEKSGQTIHLSRAQDRRWDASAQSWNEIFGQRDVEIIIRRRKTEEEDE